ncbi:hypothetical protein [Thalassoglobus polymorphus]|uniref:Uncharacterized protein n=1 Tax=Thalassoglobus polymorphus TaxID=2527994 RepID=A0A517QII1_9PLAN|nr:hypothetical protein [Thalassoglobus polymorphus]QDT31448.1 hypothetical protein Mal48_06810 [Thalassoglobus polymorphus]
MNSKHRLKTYIFIVVLFLIIVAVAASRTRKQEFFDATHVVTVHYRGLGLSVSDSWVGNKFMSVTIEYNNKTFYCQDFRDDGTCKFREECPGGTVVMRGRSRYYASDDPLGLGSHDINPYTIVSGETYDRDGLVVSRIYNGDGIVKKIDCINGWVNVVYRNGEMVSYDTLD